MDTNTLPKAELHCHLDGMLDRAMARDIRRDDPAFPIGPREFERAYPVQDRESFWNWWNFYVNSLEARFQSELRIPEIECRQPPHSDWGSSGS